MIADSNICLREVYTIVISHGDLCLTFFDANWFKMFETLQPSARVQRTHFDFNDYRNLLDP